MKNNVILAAEIDSVSVAPHYRAEFPTFYLFEFFHRGLNRKYGFGKSSCGTQHSEQHVEIELSAGTYTIEQLNKTSGRSGTPSYVWRTTFQRIFNGPDLVPWRNVDIVIN